MNNLSHVCRVEAHLFNGIGSVNNSRLKLIFKKKERNPNNVSIFIELKHELDLNFPFLVF